MKFSTMTLKQLKLYSQENRVYVTGDKRTKQAYIDSIEQHLLHYSVTEISPAEGEVIPYSAEIVLSTLPENQSFTVVAASPSPSPSPSPSNYKKVVEPLALVLGAVVLGVLWLTINGGLQLTRLIRWMKPHLKGAITKLKVWLKTQDSSWKHSFSRAIPIPIRL